MSWLGLFRKQKNVPQAESLPGEPSKRRGKEPHGIKSPSSREEGRSKGENELRPINVQGGPVTSLAFLGDGEYVVGGCKDGSIRQWRVSDWSEKGLTMKSDGAVSTVAASQDGKWVVSGGVGHKVTLWDAVSHQKVGESAEQHRSVTALDISPDSSCVASGLEDGSVFIWSLGKSWTLIAGPLRHPESQVSSVKFSPMGGRLASACTGWDCCSIRIWHGRTGDQLASLSADSRPTYSLAWSRDGQQLFAGGPRGSINCFNITTQSITSRLRDPFSDSVTSLCLSNSGQFLVACSASGCSINFWDVNTRQLIHPTFHQPSEVLAVAMSPDDRQLVCGAKDKKISVGSVSDIIPMCYLFHRLTPSLRHSDPFTYMSRAVHDAWEQGRLEVAEEMLSKEITHSDRPEFIMYSLVNRALVRARLRKWDEALEDSQMKQDSIEADVPLIAHVAKGFALLGRGNHREATEVFDFVLRGCDDDARPFVELIKFIILFEVGHHDEVEVVRYKIKSAGHLLDAKSICSVVKAQMLVILAESSVAKQNYDKALQLLTGAQDLGPFVQFPELKTISLLFGWDFASIKCTIHQLKCKSLFVSGCIREAINTLAAMESDLKDEIEKSGKVHEWLEDFKKQCVEVSGRLGEEAMQNIKHEDAIDWFSAALSLNPVSPEHILLKRSEAHAARGSWDDSLLDVDEALRRNESLPQAYKIKYRALQNLERYDEAIKIRNKLPGGDQRRAVIDRTVTETLRNAPLRMIDTKTGDLCDEAGLRSVFERDPVFVDLVGSEPERTDEAYIKHVVKGFFRYAMLSHRWQGREPLYNDVKDRSIYTLEAEEIPTATKLRTFCTIVGGAKHGYRWAWSDTCCINKNNQREFGESINSMFRWYHHSSLTLVYLWDVSPSSLPGGLTGSAWITRGWTLQEFLAPTVILFFNADWTPYLFDSHTNHKKSSKIMEEVTRAIGVPANDLLSFHPSSDDVRWKLHVASRRSTTVPQDTAYCLFGIFDVTMAVIPGETEHEAVVRLLKKVVARSKSRDVSCLAWVGESSERNSCLPTQIKAYAGSCRTPATIGKEEIERLAAELTTSFSFEDQVQAQALYNKLIGHPQAKFSGWNLSLPCIVFSVSAFDAVDRAGSDTRAYIAKAAALEPTDVLFLEEGDKPGFSPNGLLLAWPWIAELLDVAHPHGHHHGRSQSGLDVHRENGHSEAPTPSSSRVSLSPMLNLVACLRQPMTALLLSAQRPGVYKRVATEHEIVIQLRKEARLDDIAVEVVEIM